MAVGQRHSLTVVGLLLFESFGLFFGRTIVSIAKEIRYSQDVWEGSGIGWIRHCRGIDIVCGGDSSPRKIAL